MAVHFLIHFFIHEGSNRIFIGTLSEIIFEVVYRTRNDIYAYERI